MKIDTVHNKSCQSMSELPDNSIDLIATDPPYGIAFMGRSWDKFNEIVSPQGAYEKKKGFKKLPRQSSAFILEYFTPIWREALRVLKPGAFAFVMCIPRQDCLARMIMALDDAGFWIGFTSMFHAFASGFPKAQNVSLTIDKKECRKQLEEKLGKKPTRKEFEEAWEKFREVVGIKTDPRYQYGFTGTASAPMGNVDSRRTREDHKYQTVPATPQAKILDGSYTGFQPKPAVEVILVAMKPLSEKGYIDQALKNGKGITWLGNGRIPYENEGDRKSSEFGSVPTKHVPGDFLQVTERGEKFIPTGQGRFPANLLVSDDALNDGRIDKGTKPHKVYSHIDKYQGWGSITKKQGEIVNFGDSGSFSRYFSLDSWFEEKLSELPKSVQKTFPFLIVPKASKAEKNRGCEKLDTKLMARSGGAQQAEKEGKEEYLQKHIGLNRITKVKNDHPTCKPIKLMSYLITLGSRKDDIVLDPFIGSGTTAVAAKMLGRHYIGYEIDPEYCRIAEARISAVQRELF